MREMNLQSFSMERFPYEVGGMGKSPLFFKKNISRRKLIPLNLSSVKEMSTGANCLRSRPYQLLPYGYTAKMSFVDTHPHPLLYPSLLLPCIKRLNASRRGFFRSLSASLPSPVHLPSSPSSNLSTLKCPSFVRYLP